MSAYTSIIKDLEKQIKDIDKVLDKANREYEKKLYPLKQAIVDLKIKYEMDTEFLKRKRRYLTRRLGSNKAQEKRLKED